MNRINRMPRNFARILSILFILSENFPQILSIRARCSDFTIARRSSPCRPIQQFPTPMKHLLLFTTLLCIFVTGTSFVDGAERFRTDSHIIAVSKRSITVETGRAKRTYKITSQTEIKLDDRKAG